MAASACRNKSYCALFAKSGMPAARAFDFAAATYTSRSSSESGGSRRYFASDCVVTATQITPYDLVTVTVYVFCCNPFFTVIVSVFSPSDHVAAVPFSTVAPPLSIVIWAFASSATALTVLVTLVVVAEYSVSSGLNAGDRASEPIVSPERFALKGLRSPWPDGMQTSGESGGRPMQ